MRLVVWGAGELGGRVASAWAAQGQPALGLTQSSARHDNLRQQGVEARIGSAPDILEENDILLLSLPGNAKQKAAVESLATTAPPARAVFISSIGYYGAPAGVVVEETSRGETDHAKAVESAELAFSHQGCTSNRQ